MQTVTLQNGPHGGQSGRVDVTGKKILAWSEADNNFAIYKRVSPNKFIFTEMLS